MSASGEIIRAYRGFGASMQRQMESRPGEERLLAYVVVASLIFFVARVPALLKLSAAAATAEISPIALFVTNLVGSFFFAPLMLYGLAALSHLAAKAFGGHGRGVDARLALFWTLLVISPLALISTIIQIAMPLAWVSQALWLALFLIFAFAWGQALSVAEGYKKPYLAIAAIILTALGLIILFKSTLF